jgi:hypothetical protein
MVVRASSVYMGAGIFEYPRDPRFPPQAKFGYQNPGPRKIYHHAFWYDWGDPEPIWAAVGDTDVISRLAAWGPYDVFVFDHFYSVGNPFGAELIVVAYTRLPAPDDLGFVDMAWPRTLIPRDVPTRPEIVVHNFGDRAMDVLVRLTVSGPSGPVHEERQGLRLLGADASGKVVFEPVTDMGFESMVMSFEILDQAGHPSLDAFPGNSRWQQRITVTDQPVFRRVHHIPVNGVPVDFDNDGDMDIVQRSQYLKLWQNDGSGNFTDITDQSVIGHMMHPRFVCTDFNGDGSADILVSFFNQSIWKGSSGLLLGDGTGVFTDGTEQSGLSGYGPGLPFDKENDGDVDLIVPRHGGEVVMENDGTGVFTDVSLESGIVDLSQTEAISAGDLNGDGYLDLVLTNWGAEPAVYTNDGAGHFTLLTHSWGLIYGRGSVLTDYDGDGDTDIIFHRYGWGDRSLVFRNEGNLVFEDVSIEAGDIPGAFGMAAGDLNGDGTEDLVLDNHVVMLNLGGVFVDFRSHLVDASPPTAAFARLADIDGDGDLDILGGNVSAHGGDVFLSLFNQPRSIDTSPPPGPIPAEARLEQNVPNPFNPGTTIRYSISQPSRVLLAIYNVAGQRVRTLVDKIQSPRPGGYTVTWDGRNDAGQSVGSGVYLYRLETPGSVSAKKMVLLR